MKAAYLLIVLLIAATVALYVQSQQHQSEVSRLQQAHAQQMAAVANAASDALAAQVAEHERQASRVAELDHQYTQELADAELENQRLRAAVAAGDRRLYINASCPAGGNGVHQPTRTTSVDDAGTAELASTARQDYHALREQITRTEAALTGLQEYVRAVCVSGK